MTAQGKWKIMIKTPLGDKEGLLDLAVDGTSLSGSVSHAEHFAAIDNGKIHGNKQPYLISLRSRRPMLPLGTVWRVRIRCVPGGCRAGRRVSRALCT